jgi:hypothetical protein
MAGRQDRPVLIMTGGLGIDRYVMRDDGNGNEGWMIPIPGFGFGLELAHA